jgi:Glycosyltransferase family 87
MRDVLRKMLPLVALLLLAAAMIDGWKTFPNVFSLDFYHMWGVPIARDALGSNPYAGLDSYSAHLNGTVAESSSAKLHRANSARRTIQPTGTPYYYASFALLPHDFDRALAAFTLAQYLALIAAVTVLARVNDTSAWLGLLLGAAATLAFSPFAQDVKSGNVNTLQLLAFAALVLLSSARERLPAHAFRDGFPALLAAVAMFKPNTLWIVAALAAHYALVMDRALVWRGLLAGAAAALACAVIGASYFDGAGAWIDWQAYTQGMNGGRLLYDVAEGNHSVSKFLSEAAPRLGVTGAGALLTALLACAFALAAMRRRFVEAARTERTPSLFNDALFAASCGTVFMLATSPLVWPHYQVLALLPIAWLLAGNGGRLGLACAALGCVAFIAPVIGALYARSFVLGYLTVFFSWVPLAAGLCAAFAHGPRRASTPGGRLPDAGLPQLHT